MSSPYKEFKSAIAPYVIFGVGTVVALLAAPALVRGMRASASADRFVSTTAHVTSWDTHYRRGGSESIDLRFTYEVEGRSYQGSNELTRSEDSPESVARLLSTHGMSKRLTVYYDPENPDLVAISRELSFSSPLVALVAGLALSIGAALVIRHRWRQQRAAVPAVEPSP